MTIRAGSVVVGADGSSHAERALRWAVEEAALEQRPLVVVTVGRDAPRIAKEAEAFVRRADGSLTVQLVSRDGDPREVLLELAEEAHLLVVGSRGRGALTGMFLGSVSATVSSEAPCPVAVCRPCDDHQMGGGILVGADGTPESSPVVEFAYQQAFLRRLPLTVLHSFWDAAMAIAEYDRAIGRAPTVEPDLGDLRALLSMSVAGLAETYPGVRVTYELKHGFADQVLVPREHDWDLIVVGRHAATSTARLLAGSVSHAVLERARTTVAVVPAPHP